jgi:hypothetical protein
MAEAKHGCGEKGGVQSGMRRQNIFQDQLRLDLFPTCCEVHVCDRR